VASVILRRLAPWLSSNSTSERKLRSINAEIEVLLREALARRGVKVAVSAAVRRGRPPQQADDDS